MHLAQKAFKREAIDRHYNRIRNINLLITSIQIIYKTNCFETVYTP